MVRSSLAEKVEVRGHAKRGPLLLARDPCHPIGFRERVVVDAPAKSKEVHQVTAKISELESRWIAT